MARHDDGDGVPGIGMADGTGGAWPAELHRQLAVAHGGSERDLLQLRPHAALERRPRHRQGDLEAPPSSLEVLPELRGGVVQYPARRLSGDLWVS